MVKKLTLKNFHKDVMGESVIHMLKNVSGVSDAKIDEDGINVLCVPETSNSNIIHSMAAIGCVVEKIK